MHAVTTAARPRHAAIVAVTLVLTIAAAILIAPARAHAATLDAATSAVPRSGAAVDFARLARAEAVRAGIRHPVLFVRQMAAESRFHPCITSPAGAQGIAQIMPGTAAEWEVDPLDPAAALRESARRMAEYERSYGRYTLALAAYNAGPGAVARFGGVPPYRETIDYVRKITNLNAPIAGLDATWGLPQGLDPEFSQRLEQLQRAVEERGGQLQATRGWRSWDRQQQLWDAAKERHGGWAQARAYVDAPACSPHVHGVAAHLSGDLELARQLASSVGLKMPDWRKDGLVLMPQRRLW
jgi:hypothetical protein